MSGWICRWMDDLWMDELVVGCSLFSVQSVSCRTMSHTEQKERKKPTCKHFSQTALSLYSSQRGNLFWVSWCWLQDVNLISIHTLRHVESLRKPLSLIVKLSKKSSCMSSWERERATALMYEGERLIASSSDVKHHVTELAEGSEVRDASLVLTLSAS